MGAGHVRRLLILFAERLLLVAGRDSAVVQSVSREVSSITNVPGTGIAKRAFCGHMGMFWEELSGIEQNNWEILGWTQEGWDDESAQFRPHTSDVVWDELTKAEKRAAIALGYDAQIWDMDVDQDLRFTTWCDGQSGNA